MVLQKVRWRFIIMSIVSLAIVIFGSLGGLVLISFSQARGESNQVMQTLVANGGTITPRNAQAVVGNANDFFSRRFSAGQGNPESVYQYRYFTVRESNNNVLQIVNGQKVYGLTDNRIVKTTKNILASGKNSGVVRLAANTYRYQTIKQDRNQQMVIFLNTSLIYAHSWYLLRVSILVSLATLLVFALIFAALSKRAIKPVAAAYRKQREFITNAGHELKTPLAIIAANTEMEEMIGNESEWTESTKQQTQRLTNLINQFLSMARLGETGDLVLSKNDFSEIVLNSANSFKSLMKSDHLTYAINVQPGLKVMGEKRSLGELVNILVDNAHKYCLKDGRVSVNLHKSKLGKSAILQVSNSFKDENKIDFNNFFERFYREDESHNSKKSGFGIGLSMAQTLVKVFGGKIEVHYANEMITFQVSLKLVR
jgi:signal transduction histidine kinase